MVSRFFLNIYCSSVDYQRFKDVWKWRLKLTDIDLGGWEELADGWWHAVQVGVVKDGGKAKPTVGDQRQRRRERQGWESRYIERD